MAKELFLDHSVIREDRPDGAVLLRSGLELGPVARNTGQWLHQWATDTPDRIFIAEREGEAWREISYSQMLAKVRSVAQGLLSRGIGPGSTIVVLSGPSVDHGILALAAQYIGALHVPLAEQYSLIPEAQGRLLYCVDKVGPDMVYAADGAVFSGALTLPVFDSTTKVVSSNNNQGELAFTDFFETPGPQVDISYAAVGPDTVAKILFTSGSTSDPKGVPQTQRMMCVNQAQSLATLPILRAQPHKMLDWLPWNHVFAGSANFNMMLSNGGSLYLDDGKPVGAKAARTVENMHMHQSTLSFDVPVAHAMQVEALKADPDLRKKYFSALTVFFYAGASLPDDVWASIEEMSLAEKGEVPLMMSSWGLTETAPAVLNYYEKGATSGLVGVPVPGAEMKLLALGDGRYDVRVRGPNIFTGYLNDPARTAAAFDEEGFFISGDAMRFVNPEDASRGLRFDGRIGEDFKLLTGTWVQASTIRLNALPEFGELITDLVVVGEGKPEVGVLIFPPAGAELESSDGAVVDADYQRSIGAVLNLMSTRVTGSSQRITRALVLANPPDVSAGEITAKGSLNVRAIVTCRASMYERLYDDTDPAVIHIDK